MRRNGGTWAAALAIAVLAVVVAAILLGWPSARPPAGSAATPGGTVGPAPTPTIDRPLTTGSAGSPTEPGGASPAASGTGASPSESVVLVGAGDIADCSSDGDSQTAAILDALPHATIFTLGDNAYENGTRQEFDACYGPTWGRHLDRTRPSPGNHDYNTAGASGYFEYFGDRAGPDRRGYYAYALGAWRIYSLNSNCEPIGGCGADSEQLTWLRDDLAQHPGGCAVAYWHHPRFSSGDHGNVESMDQIWDTLVEAGVEIAMAGHDHSYERLAPMNGSGDADPDRGMMSFVVGTGGRARYEFGDVLATSEARDNTAWGVLELTLSPGSWSARFIPAVAGGFTDRTTGTCR
jgi:acid phosphatase type 7